VEVAAGGTGGHPVTRVSGRRRSDLVLFLVALLLACLVAAGGVLTYREHDSRERAAAEQERYGDVLAAATSEAEAFINIRYDRAQESIDKVAEGATGSFKEEYTSSAGGVLEVLRQEKSIMDGKVVWAGVVDVDQDSATVIAATSGTVANVQTDNKPVARNFRLQLDLVLEDGAWLTNDLQFVG
jgi:Mce-associated membrane protein